jgi:hypothetical protein
MKPKLLLILPVLLFFIMMSLYESRGPNSNNAKSNEIEKLYAAMPTFPGMTEVDTSRSSSGHKAHVSKVFNSDAPYDVVKRFYMSQLTERGWTVESERQLTSWGDGVGGQELKFSKGEYMITLEYSGEKASAEWDYAIGIYWYDQ